MSYNIYRRFVVNFENMSYEATGGENNCYSVRNKRAVSNMDFNPSEPYSTKRIKDLVTEYNITKKVAFIFIVIQALEQSVLRPTVSQKLRDAVKAVKDEFAPELKTTDFLYSLEADKVMIEKAADVFIKVYSKTIKAKEIGEWIIKIPYLNGYVVGVSKYTLDVKRAKVYKTLEAAENVASRFQEYKIIKIG